MCKGSEQPLSIRSFTAPFFIAFFYYLVYNQGKVKRKGGKQMTIKVTSKGQAQADLAKEHQRRGRRSRAKGSSFERTVAKKFKEYYNADLMRTPQSGGFAKNSAKADDFRGDIVPVDKNIDLTIHVECKNAKTWSLPAWLKQAESDCPEGRYPVVIFHKHGTSEDYITLSLEHFFELVPRDNIIKEKVVTE